MYVICDKKLEEHTHLIRHSQNLAYQKNSRKVTSSGNIKEILTEPSTELNAERKAEYQLIMELIIEHNCSFLLMDHLPKRISACLPDSKIAKKVQCGRTKFNKMVHMLHNEAKEILM